MIVLDTPLWSLSKWAGESRFSLETAQEGVGVRIQKKNKKRLKKT